MDRREAVLRLRSIQVAYRVSARLRPADAARDAQQQLERLAIQIDPETDPELEKLIREVRSEIQMGR